MILPFERCRCSNFCGQEQGHVQQNVGKRFCFSERVLIRLEQADFYGKRRAPNPKNIGADSHSGSYVHARCIHQEPVLIALMVDEEVISSPKGGLSQEGPQ